MTGGGWQYARWGMSGDDVVAASAGTARRIDDAEREDQSGIDFVTLAVAEAAIGPFEFDVSFRAARDGTTLRSVRLELRDADQYEELLEVLRREYGAGDPIPANGDASIEGRRWHTSDGAISLKRLIWPMDLGVDVVVDYEEDPGPPAT